MKAILALLLIAILLLAAFAGGIYLTGYIIKYESHESRESQTPNTTKK